MRSDGLGIPNTLAIAALLAALASAPVPSSAQETGGAGHAHEPAGSLDATPLEEPGDASFAALQEVVEALRRAEDTDWTHVDLERRCGCICGT